MTNAQAYLLLLLGFAGVGVSQTFTWRRRRRSGQPAPQGSSRLLSTLCYPIAIVMGLQLYDVVSTPGQVRPANGALAFIAIIYAAGLLVLLAGWGVRAYRALHHH